jgi:hypothetical protein
MLQTMPIDSLAIPEEVKFFLSNLDGGASILLAG